jgi:hypothetical protein|eukprot:TRINITY_DN24149_c0_g1_i1.p1 TRINITY_DN24149_c0_g1~~TRINITY_DN24149_c0_g1_i1.p1  ORF type:complete len:121 (+),score=25.06 TRINITY_DN24149_c0_g1_i1:114-476(+)
MKKVILAIALLVAVTTSGFSFSGEVSKKENASIELIANSDLKFKLALDNVKEKSSLVIRDQYNQVLYSASLPKSENYSKIFDLSGLADGSYSFVISNGSEVTVKPFEIATETKRLVTAVK